MSRQDQDFAALRFGLGPAQAGEDWSPDGMVAMVSGMKAEQRLKLQPASERFVERLRLLDLQAKKPASERRTAKRSAAEYYAAAYRSDVHARVMWAVKTQNPFAERLLAFWSNHFTVSRRKTALVGLVGPYEAEAILPHIGGRFVDLLRAAVQHPAMLIYLDQSNSIGPNSQRGKEKNRGLNENLAREILELHTLGVHGGYTQADVTAFAKIMTGWAINRKTGITEFRRNSAEPGKKSLLGQSFSGKTPKAADFDAALDFIAAHPATAKHVATRLVMHFISDTPTPDDVRDIETAFLGSSGNLLDVYRALAALPGARKPATTKARNDRDFLIAALRATDIPDDALVTRNGKGFPLTLSALAALQQPYWQATSPQGWSEQAEEWLSPAGLAGRLQLIPQLVQKSRIATPAELLDRALGEAVGERTRKIVNAASNREEAMALVLASPEFNRR